MFRGEKMSDYDRPADGWAVFNMGGRAVSAGRTPDDATTRAEAMGVMPLRARIERATVAELDALANELPPVALGVASDGLPWWRHGPQWLDLPALHCPVNAESFRWRIQYNRPGEEAIRECYTGPHMADARYLIDQLRAAGTSVIPPGEDDEEDH